MENIRRDKRINKRKEYKKRTKACLTLLFVVPTETE